MTESEALDAMPVRSSAWRWAGPLVLLYWAGALFIYRATALSIESIWARSDTFAHGYLIVPIAVWLIYRRRDVLANLNPCPSVWGLLLLLGSVLLWVAASLVDVLVVQQLALVMILLAGSWAILGTSVVRVIAFPLAFLFLAVPMGEDLIPMMQEFTATATVRLVELSGVAVYRDGLHFSLPTGNWQVVEACSGVRYLIASGTLGLLYAHLSYSSFWKQLLFVLLSLAVPVLANALRAYLIVMLGHVSKGRLAAGVDHLIYGWVFFGLVMLLLFWLGSRWAEDDAQVPVIPANTSGATASGRWALPGALLAALALAGSGSMLIRQMDNVQVTRDAVQQQVYRQTEVPKGDANWQVLTGSWPWRPAPAGAQRVSERAYQGAQQQVFLTVQAHTDSQRTAAATIARFRRQLGAQEGWKILDVKHTKLPLGKDSFTVLEALLDSGTQRLRVWYWLRIGNYYTANPYFAKAFELLQRIGVEPSVTERFFLVSTESSGRSAEQVMQEFLQQQRQLTGLAAGE